MQVQAFFGEFLMPPPIDFNQKLQQDATPPNNANEEDVDEQLHRVTEEFCNTPQCVISASQMDSLIDWKADPCDDFYNFACGRFIRDSTLHDRRDSLSIFSLTDDKLKDQLRRLFTREMESDEIKPYRMAKALFKSCINVSAIELRGTEPLRNLIDSVGGWPMLPNWNDTAWDLERSIMKFRENLGESAGNIFRKAQLARPSKSSSQTSKTIANDSNRKDFRVFASAFRSYLIDIAVIVGAERNAVESQIDDAIEFERKLIKLNSRHASRLINIEAPSELQNEFYVKFQLTQWLDLFLPAPPLLFASGTSEKLNSSEFLWAFEKLLAGTSKRTLGNYFIMRIVGFSSQFMTKAMKERALHYRMELFGVKQKPEGWKQCVDVVSSLLRLAAEAMFSREYFDLESKQTAIDITQRVKNVFEELLASNLWLSGAAKTKVLVKTNEIIAKLQFPKELLSDRQVEFFYRKLSIDDDKYLESVLRLKIFSTDRKFLLMQAGINLESGDTGSVGILNSVDVKDFNKIRTSTTAFNCRISLLTFYGTWRTFFSALSRLQCFRLAFCSVKFYRPNDRNI